MSLGVSELNVSIVNTALMAQLTIIGAGLGLAAGAAIWFGASTKDSVMIRGVHCGGELVPGLSG
jgi:hypothetical protein